MSSGQAIIGPIEVFPHPNADRLQLGRIYGYQVVVGNDVKTGDEGIFFPEGTQLSREYATANELLRAQGGYFENNRRVRCQKFRGEKSEGYWAPLSSLNFIEWRGERLKTGDKLSQLNGTPLCQKYVTPATRVRRERKKTTRGETVMFKKHFDTDQLRMNLGYIKPGLKVVVTQKVHGTSQRMGFVKDKVKLAPWKRFINFFAPVFPTVAWGHLIGSRNVILEPHENGRYYTYDFRVRAAEMFYGKLRKGETVYYEVVGFEEFGKPIMSTVSTEKLKDKSVKTAFGDKVTYTYGCADGEFDVYVYRITFTNEDGDVFELPWEQVKARCQELNVNHVPEFLEPSFDWEGDVLMAECDEICNYGGNVPDPIDPRHPLEGVCVRVEHGHRTRIFKHKSFLFGVLEGYLKEDDAYVDTEETS